MQKKVLILMGATGVGKTKFSILLAQRFNLEIISADSVAVYKDFDVGSAKITDEEKGGIVHYGIDIVSPTQDFTCGDFCKYTLKTIDEIHGRGKIPLIVGGTGLYIKSLVNGYNLGGVERHLDLRENLEEMYAKEGIVSLQNRLRELNEDVYNTIDRNNKVRLIRAIEIETYGGNKSKKESDYDFKIIALNIPREELYAKINQRTKLMLKNGLIEETKHLYQQYGDCKPLNAIGYKETVSYLKGEINLEKLEELISQHTRNYAKRQLTFMRSVEGIEFIDATNESEINAILKEIEKWIKQK